MFGVIQRGCKIVLLQMVKTVWQKKKKKWTITEWNVWIIWQQHSWSLDILMRHCTPVKMCCFWIPRTSKHYSGKERYGCILFSKLGTETSMFVFPFGLCSTVNVQCVRSFYQTRASMRRPWRPWRRLWNWSRQPRWERDVTISPKHIYISRELATDNPISSYLQINQGL